MKSRYRQVRVNIRRFPEEFMFRLTVEEKDELVQICHRFEKLKHSTSAPYVFTEHGVTMLSSVLNSDRAIKINIAIVKAFVRLREIISTHKELVHKLKELENRVDKHDNKIRLILEAIKQLMAPPPVKDRVITGFKKGI